MTYPTTPEGWQEYFERDSERRRKQRARQDRLRAEAGVVDIVTLAKLCVMSAWTGESGGVGGATSRSRADEPPGARRRTRSLSSRTTGGPPLVTQR